MAPPVVLAEQYRGQILESWHTGHAVVCNASGEIEQAWGDPDATIYPRSSCKMFQALPLVESGAADAMGLTARQLALACASHTGAAIHTDMVIRWLTDLGLGESDLRCGPQMPDDPAAMKGLLCSDTAPCQIHNNCSGKHTGFLALNRHLGGGPDYHEVTHPVQVAVRAAFEEVTGEASPGFGIDGCSAPNFATSIGGLARGLARFAGARDGGGTRETAMARLREAMRLHPALTAGEGDAATELALAMDRRVVMKSGASGMFVAIVPDRRLSVAVKITDGSEQARHAVIAAILVKLGLLEANHPVTRRYLDAPVLSRRGLHAGEFRAADCLR